MDQQYYIRLRGRVQGPFPAEKLQALARRGKFNRHYQVSTDRATWEPASRHPDLLPTGGPPKLRQTPAVDEPSEPVEPSEKVAEEPTLETLVEAGDDLQQWYYARDGEETGPVTMETIQLLASTGQLTVDDYLWTDGMPEWAAAGDVPGVFADPYAASPASEPHDRTVSAVASAGGGSGSQIAPMAVASFVLGLLGTSILYFMGSILAIVFGHIALKQIQESDEKLGGRGLAISGLILGYLVVVATVLVGTMIATIIILGSASL